MLPSTLIESVISIDFLERSFNALFKALMKYPIFENSLMLISSQNIAKIISEVM